MSRLFALIALIAFSPIIIIAAFLVAVSDGRNPFYGQWRVGKNGKLFRMWKIRTMRHDADKIGSWTTANDPRVIPVIGRMLRNSNIDELPQFWNVVKGDMNWIGPRPEQPQYVEKFSKEISWYNDRHRVKPGLTGWAVINKFTGNCDIARRTEYDIWGIEHRNFWLNLQILWRTFCFKRKAA